jgi:hypothetical protein
MAKVPTFAKAFAGRWRIADMHTSTSKIAMNRLRLRPRPSSSTAC